jgi:hypothetical protein
MSTAKTTKKASKKSTAKKSSKAPATKSVAAKGAASEAPPTPDAATTIAAYDRRLPDLAKVPADKVVTLHASPIVALQHVEDAIAVLSPHRADIEAAPKCDWPKASAATDYALGLFVAANNVSPDATGAVADDLHRAQALRATLLDNAVALAGAGLLPAAKVKEIHSHRGGVAHAADLGTLVQLFKSNAKKIAGKTPVTAAQLADAAALSTSLARALHPKGRKKQETNSPERAEAIDIRDRFWTLLMESYAELWRAGAYLFGQAWVTENVPPLGGIERGKHRAKVAAPAGAGGAPATGKPTA